MLQRERHLFARIIKWMSMACTGHVTSLGELTNAYRISVYSPKGKEHFET
jgi:hypothetical protein